MAVNACRFATVHDGMTRQGRGLFSNLVSIKPLPWFPMPVITQTTNVAKLVRLQAQNIQIID
jgi:hypothetical protein